MSTMKNDGYEDVREVIYLRHLKRRIMHHGHLPEYVWTFQDASREAKARFGFGTSRYVSFMEGWLSLVARHGFVRQKYIEKYGRGRRSGGHKHA